VMLNNSLNSDKSKPGDKLSAKLEQDVTLPDGSTVKAGSEFFGHVVSASRGSGTTGARVVLVFDQIKMNGKRYPITTAARAVASMMAVFQARQPISSVAGDAGSSWDYNTRQVGGDIVFGRKDVRSNEGVVGVSPEPGWVVGVPRGNSGAGCAAPDSKALQSFWVFSTNACGVYGDGEDEMQISRKPEDNENGQITLTSPKRVQVRNGSALLLTVLPQAATQTVQ